MPNSPSIDAFLGNLQAGEPEYHPASEAYPLHDISELKDSLTENGWSATSVILLDELGRVIAGRHRLLAITELGMDVPATNIAVLDRTNGETDRNYSNRCYREAITSNNEGRAMDVMSKALVAARMVETPREGGGDTGANQYGATAPRGAVADFKLTRAMAAKIHGISENSVTRARTITAKRPNWADSLLDGGAIQGSRSLEKLCGFITASDRRLAEQAEREANYQAGQEGFREARRRGELGEFHSGMQLLDDQAAEIMTYLEERDLEVTPENVQTAVEALSAIALPDHTEPEPQADPQPQPAPQPSVNRSNEILNLMGAILTRVFAEELVDLKELRDRLQRSSDLASRMKSLEVAHQIEALTEVITTIRVDLIAIADIENVITINNGE